MANALYGPLERPLRFVYLIVGQMLLIITAFAYLNLLRIEYFIVGSFIVVLVTAELTAPLTVRPEWRKRLRRVLVSWFFVFMYVAYQRTAALLGSVVS